MQFIMKILCAQCRYKHFVSHSIINFTDIFSCTYLPFDGFLRSNLHVDSSRRYTDTPSSFVSLEYSTIDLFFMFCLVRFSTIEKKNNLRMVLLLSCANDSSRTALPMVSCAFIVACLPLPLLLRLLPHFHQFVEC